MEEKDTLVKELEKLLRERCLDKAMNLYGASKYIAATNEDRFENAENIISAAKSFYSYILGENETIIYGSKVQ